MKGKKEKSKSKKATNRADTQQIDFCSASKKTKKSSKLNQTYEADFLQADSTVNIKLKNVQGTTVKNKRTPKSNVNKTKPISKKSPKKTTKKKPAPKSGKSREVDTTGEISMNTTKIDSNQSKPSIAAMKPLSNPTPTPCPAIASSKEYPKPSQKLLFEEVPDQLYLTPQLKPQLPAVPHEQIKAEESFQSLQVSIEGCRDSIIPYQDQSGYHTPTFGGSQAQEEKIDPTSVNTSRKSTSHQNKSNFSMGRTSALDQRFQILMKGKYQFMKKFKSREEAPQLRPSKPDSLDGQPSNVLKEESQDDIGDSPLDKSSSFNIKRMFEYNYPKIHSSKEQEQMELYLQKRSLKDQLLINQQFDHSRKIQPSYNFKSLRFVINSKVILESISVFVIYRDRTPPPKSSPSPRKKKIPVEKAEKDLPKRGRKMNETFQISIPCQQSIEKPQRVIRKVVKPRPSKELQKLMNPRQKEALNKQRRRQNEQQKKLISKEMSCSVEMEFPSQFAADQKKVGPAKTPRKR